MNRTPADDPQDPDPLIDISSAALRGGEESLPVGGPQDVLEALHDPYSALRIADYRFFLTGNLLASFGLQMQKVTVGWEIVDRTHSVEEAAAAVTWVGVAQVLPMIALAIPVGHIIDRTNRKWIIALAALSMAVGSLGLAVISWFKADFLWMYACLLLHGLARAFQQPAKAAFLPQIVPRERFSNAVTWNTGGFHMASIAGPLLAGGLLYSFRSAAVVYIVDTAALLVLVVLLAFVRGRAYTPSSEPTSFRTLLAGISFVWRTKLILGAITLDMFAVLLGGATALLPLYAEQILHVGPVGLGALSAAPALGALTMAFVLAHLQPMQRAGHALLWSVAGFGVATIIFGISTSFTLSLAMLFVTGACDNISVVIRHTLVQILTPDDMRGRVAAVNSMFIGASNELGASESGLVAQYFGPIVSVVSGGIGTLLVVLAVALTWPQVRRYRKLGDHS